MNIAAIDGRITLDCSEEEARQLLEIFAAYVCSPVIEHADKAAARDHYQKLFLVVRLIVDKRRVKSIA